MAREIILAGGMRTPFGDFGKSLKDIPLATLGIHATRACLEKAGLDAGQGLAMPIGRIVHFADERAGRLSR